MVDDQFSENIYVLFLNTAMAKMVQKIPPRRICDSHLFLQYNNCFELFIYGMSQESVAKFIGWYRDSDGS